MLLLLVTQKAILGMCTDLTDLGGPLLKSLYLLHQASKKQFKPQKKSLRIPHTCLQMANQILGLEASSVSSSTKLPTLSHPHPSQCKKHFAFICTRYKVSEFTASLSAQKAASLSIVENLFNTREFNLVFSEA